MCVASTEPSSIAIELGGLGKRAIFRFRFRRAKRRAAGAVQRQGLSRVRGCFRRSIAPTRSKNEMRYARVFNSRNEQASLRCEATRGPWTSIGLPAILSPLGALHCSRVWRGRLIAGVLERGQGEGRTRQACDRDGGKKNLSRGFASRRKGWVGCRISACDSQRRICRLQPTIAARMAPVADCALYDQLRSA